jgi:hypothetical protein
VLSDANGGLTHLSATQEKLETQGAHASPLTPRFWQVLAQNAKYPH